MPTIAILSDIHGNLPALAAVIADFARAPDAVYVLGDMVNGCPWSGQVLDSMQAHGWPMLLGNHDDAVLQLGTPRMEPRYADRQRFGALWWTREHLSEHQLALLTGLPLELTLAGGAPPIRLVHGVPGNFFVGFGENVPAQWAEKRLAGVVEPVVACGHTHIPLVRTFGRWLVVNAGSVGAPYDGDPRASYAWLEGSESGWRAEICRVGYDLDAVSAGFEQSGLLAEAGVTAELFRRSVLSGLPWVADFLWWMRDQPADLLADMRNALRVYDIGHGPGRWAFPYA